MGGHPSSKGVRGRLLRINSVSHLRHWCSVIDGLIDHLGGVNVVTGANGLQAERVEYEPYGKTIIDEKNNPGQKITPYYFTGQYLDPESDLYYYGARYYNPAIGRFISADSLVQSPGLSQSLNRYSYVLNNPINRIDPSGNLSFFMNEAEANEQFFNSFVQEAKGFVGGIFSAFKDIPGTLRAFDNTMTAFEQNPFGFAGAALRSSAESTFEAFVTGDTGKYIFDVLLFTNGSGALGKSSSVFGETKTFYRTMALEHYDELLLTGKIPASTETFISPSLAYAQKFSGVNVQLTVNASTIDSLLDIGVRNAAVGGEIYGSLPLVQSGWTSSNAFFKYENNVINIGLGNGKALDIFNHNLIDFKKVSK